MADQPARTYRVEIEWSAWEEITALPERLKDRIVDAIEALELNPRPSGCKKLKASPYYRIRVGDYRVIYSIEDAVLLVVIVEVPNRKDAYR